MLPTLAAALVRAGREDRRRQ